jgi:uncharacterized protein
MQRFDAHEYARCVLQFRQEKMRAMNLPPYFKVQGDVIHLYIRAQPRASRNEIGEVLGHELKVKITAPPVDSAANEALIEFLAEVLDCPRGALQLVRGRTSRHKVVAVRGLSPETLAQRLDREKHR